MGERTHGVQKVILGTEQESRASLAELKALQVADFEGLLEAMDGLPVVVRLLDPPLHEFLPSRMEIEQEMYRRVPLLEDITELQAMSAQVEHWEEVNPMMGLRGIRLGITMPEITQMQVRAIFEAAANQTLAGVEVKPEVMIPLTGTVNELHWIQPRLEKIAKAVMEEKGVSFEYKFGTMIEIPRAAVTAAEIAGLAEFFSFGTNDLTQMTFGYSRDDAERNFLITYVEQGILPKNPFQTIDREGVGRLMQIAVDDGRKARPDLEVGICGEHGGDPNSIEFCHMIGNNYVSCSPFRVPVARLAAAHSALKFRK